MFVMYKLHEIQHLTGLQRASVMDGFLEPLDRCAAAAPIDEAAHTRLVQKRWMRAQASSKVAVLAA